MENFYDILRNSESPNLQVAKAIIVILIDILVHNAGDGLLTFLLNNNHSHVAVRLAGLRT